jgi:hypothetical protein
MDVLDTSNLGDTEFEWQVPVGFGAQSVVVKAVWRNIPVAVKLLPYHRAYHRESFESEANFHSALTYVRDLKLNY